MRKTIQVIMPAVLLPAGIAMMIFGVLRGELQDIFRKAIIICLECIGIG